ncbi:MAG: hypothetical protein J0M10_13690 [Chitinophagales bacterium]|nr:hypothetical protein [Chitinophagales bacterium]
MPDQFVLKKDNSPVKYKAEVSSIGNASTVPRLKNKTGETKNLQPSPPAKNGSIPKRELGHSNELSAALLSYDTAILLDNIPDAQIEQAFTNLIIKYTLFGGQDGDKEFILTAAEKLLFKEQKLIVASKAIQLI